MPTNPATGQGSAMGAGVYGASGAVVFYRLVVPPREREKRREEE